MPNQVKVVIKRKPPKPMQTTNHILMIEPVAFGFNAQTAKNNYFQHKTLGAQPKALAEFQALVKLLQNNNVDVITFKDSLLPHTPDSIFPNNAVTFFGNAKAFLYPMFAPNRRHEISHEMLHEIKEKGFILKEIYDMQAVADSEHYLEGTGSMVLDRINEIAYACRSDRTSEKWFKKTCRRLGYEAIFFTANQSITWRRLPIHHTNTVMSIGETFVVICLESIDNEEDKEILLDKFTRTGKEFIAINEKQMHQFAGNIIQVRTNNNLGGTALVMSTNAYNCLTTEQIERIEAHCPILHTDLSTIEENGGGSARSMMAEIFLPQHRKSLTVAAKIKS